MRVLDLGGGGGGAADGYVDAGYEVVGVDTAYQPSYPYEFIQTDAFTFLRWADLSKFDFIHASPPCQGYSLYATSRDSRYSSSRGKNEPKLIEPLRETFKELGKDYVIENVMGAKRAMESPVLLCGAMFDLPIPRHRLFESSFKIVPPFHPPCEGMAREYADEHGLDSRRVSVTGKGRGAGTTELWATLMGMDRYMRQTDYAEAIPPAYTKFIGKAYRERE
jgi:DNA (cytosine-5)-methyltransferase 1